MAKMSEAVVTAIKLAEEAGWPTDRRNGKVVITAPDGVTLTIGLTPNEASLHEWKRRVAQYNLVEGPAMTPGQQLEAKARAEAEKSKKGNTPTPAELRKRVEAEEARKKAEAVVAAAAKLPAPPASFTEPQASTPRASTSTTIRAVPVVKIGAQVASKRKMAVKADSDAFPPFTPDMLVGKDYSRFKLSNSRYFCPNCWERGEKFTTKLPQGLASHRGFNHGIFSNGVREEENNGLPESIITALELLKSELAETLANSTDSAKLSEMEARLTEITAKLEERDRQITILTKERDQARDIAKERIEALDKEQARHGDEVRQVMAGIEADLRDVREWINNLAPVKVVAKLDALVTKYLGE